MTCLDSRLPTERGPMVSVIIPTHQNYHGLERAVESVFDQTYQNIEVLIVDDASAEPARSEIERIATRDPRVELLRLNENYGAGVARRQGQIRARGEYIAFLDADDIWLPEKLAVQIGLMIENNWNLSHTSYYKSSSPPNTSVEPYAYGLSRVVHARPVVDYDMLLSSNWIACSTAVYRRANFGKMYMPDLRRRQDYAFWLSLLRTGEKSYGVTKPLTVYCVGNGSLSSNKLRAAIEHYRVLKDYTDLAWMERLKRFSIYVGHAFRKYKI